MPPNLYNICTKNVHVAYFKKQSANRWLTEFKMRGMFIPITVYKRTNILV